jgi:hypothetical protein
MILPTKNGPPLSKLLLFLKILLSLFNSYISIGVGEGEGAAA